MRCAIFLLLLGNASLHGGTVAHYRFENDYTDSSGNGLDGAGNGALAFDSNVAASDDAGSSALNATADFDYVSVSHNAAFELQTFTLEAFVRVPTQYTNTVGTVGPNSQYIAHKLRSTSSGSFLSSYGISVDQSSSAGSNLQPGAVRATIALSTGGISLTSNAAINDNAWHHVALTFSGTVATLYVDGRVEDVIGGLGGSVLHGDAPFLVGSGNFAGSTSVFRRNLDGWVDEVRLTNTTLSPSEFLVVPEPSTALLGCLGLAGLLLRRR
ncbi:LamG domain-containing protein [Haloferula rosea]|uniref:LamG domain-containing protein n=1 Tax=Haloferula rosea TaxID=490093 RepID=A0A934RDF4_9BACT|nr:LamG domain-containing protein [Haloferula rosea]MBK1828698.1 LamG domain-containing protein [Haloferula rosea]